MERWACVLLCPVLRCLEREKTYLGTIGVGVERRGRREIPEKTRRPPASSGTIRTRENPVTRPGIEPGSPWWEASVLIAQPPCPPHDKIDVKHVYTEVDFAIGSQFIRHALDDSEPIADGLGLLFTSRSSEPMRESKVRGSAVMKGRGKREIPEKTRRPAALFGSIPTCKNPERNKQLRIIAAPHQYASTALTTVSVGAATVAERLSCSPPPIKENRIQSPAMSLLDFRKLESRRTMPLDGGFSSWTSRFPRPCTPALLKLSPHFTLIGSQDLVVKSRPNIFTQSSLTRAYSRVKSSWSRGDPAASPGVLGPYVGIVCPSASPASRGGRLIASPTTSRADACPPPSLPRLLSVPRPTVTALLRNNDSLLSGGLRRPRALLQLSVEVTAGCRAVDGSLRDITIARNSEISLKDSKYELTVTVTQINITKHEHTTVVLLADRRGELKVDQLRRQAKARNGHGRASRSHFRTATAVAGMAAHPLVVAID
ncbi:hypothetical protein PR048_023764 [Dryococelus australis]|uniref:Rhodanese domain-containing protein n=1 Tax=Dryococelus australis TaxID=614101 RepID=A0ABQ9GV17_9NEOP|nr:hypothetical protein PR048_023764 [Dryococelus australis]